MTQEQCTALLREMTLEEKIGQLVQLPAGFYEGEGAVTGPAADLGLRGRDLDLAGSVLGMVGAEKLAVIQRRVMQRHPRHIPLLTMADIINGCRTVFPIPLAQGCAFRPGLAREGARIAARESAASGIHVTFSPMADLARDARWGRVMESTGEDTYLNCLYSRAFVEGYQGESLAGKENVAACVKHFAAYGAPTAGREYNNVELSERTLRGDYLPAYQAAVDAGCAMAMTSFNTLDRIPSTANRRLMRDILRGEMGFEGVLISDWAAIQELIYHGVAADAREAARLAIEAGVDIDMSTSCYLRELEGLVRDGVVPMERIDEAALRVLTLKNRLGLFEDPFRNASPEREKSVLLCAPHREAARKAAAETFVLLKNEGNLLPLKKQGARIAVVGPYAESRAIFGSWSIFAEEADCVTLREGVESKTDNAAFASGCPMLRPEEVPVGFAGSAVQEDPLQAGSQMAQALEAARQADVAVVAIGEHRQQSGEAGSRGEIAVPEVQMDLLRRVRDVQHNVVIVLFTGRPLDLREVSRLAGTVLVAWFPGTEGGNALADVLFGDRQPSGRLCMSFPYSVGQVPVFYNAFSTGRPDGPEHQADRFRSRYIDIPNEPLYPFGFGLGYASFAYSPVSLDHAVMTPDHPLTASVTVCNTGPAPGTETVQMYIQDVVASVARPVRELRGFQKVELAPGESREVRFTVTEEMLRFYRLDMSYASEPGEFHLFIGGDSTTDNKAVFTLSK